MKVLHLPGTFLPDYRGGKEVFVYQLIKNTPAITHHVAYQKKGDVKEVSYDGISITQLPWHEADDLRHAYFSLLYDSLPGFENLLDSIKPDLVHFHDFCIGASLSHLRICKARKIKTLVTYHAPGSSCLQRGLIHAGKEVCNGVIDVQRCTSCRYQLKGLPAAVAGPLSALNLSFDKTGKYNFKNSTTLFYNSWKEFFSQIDAVQIHAQWVEKMLIDNAVDKSKITYVEMGGHPSLPVEEWRTPDKSAPLNIVFVGRCVSIKGVHLLIEAVKKLPPGTPVEIHFFGQYWDDDYGKLQKSRIKGDTRFKEPRLIPSGDIVSELRAMDICIIPSLWPETGPFTVFDAFAAGLPVIGTGHAGISERISDGTNGLLFEWDNSSDLSEKIKLVLNDRSLLDKFKSGIRPNNTFAKMALDIQKIYDRMIN